MATLPCIAQEIIEENILTRLPVKSVLRLKCVCKYWCNDLFQNPRFITLHLQHAIVMNRFIILGSQYQPHRYGLCSIDHNVLPTVPSVTSKFIVDVVKIDIPFTSGKRVYATHEPTQIHGSCNGLVCIEPDCSDIFIWNPCTKEYKQVPKTPIEFPSEEEYETDDDEPESGTAYGFGYDHEIVDYKLLRIVGFDYKYVSEVRVYTLHSDSWKHLGFIPYYNFSVVDINAGCLIDGVLHWVAIAHHSKTEFESEVVVSFDICSETFCEMPLPDNSKSWINLDHLKLGVWEGKLCLVLMHNFDNVVLWTMKDHTWIKQMNITSKLADIFYGRPIQIFQNGEILFLYEEQWEDCLISYDPKLESARVLKIPYIPHQFFKLETYIGTLVSLNSGTFVGKDK